MEISFKIVLQYFNHFHVLFTDAASTICLLDNSTRATFLSFLLLVSIKGFIGWEFY